ncbi:DUF2961 domain-containing protein [Aquisphaera insulae]|uniref:DUF2961 domain-containing protein n=1 Tax=Aquisphaera insulae TaxID=2712864 RepID=UPI0013ED67BA|nr:DUF2961 domain-containing protein [Aquisphaera insulae]
MNSETLRRHRLLRAIARALLPAAALLITSRGVLAQAEVPLSYSAVLHQLTDLDRLARLQEGCKAGLSSSWDRGSRERWGANGDASQYLRIEPDGEAVMMDVDGPGVVYRIWSANPIGKIRIYLDGATSPSYEWDFPDLFDGKTPPFVRPLVYRRDRAQSASDCYLPIPFAKHLKITADKKHSQYYQFNYLLYPKGRSVASFHLPLAADEQAALDRAVRAWSAPGRDPKPRLSGQASIARTVTIEPGRSVDLCDLHAAGSIRAIRVKLNSRQRYAWRKVVLRGAWDGASRPQVLTPLGPFFGFDWEAAEYGSVVAGCQQGRAYQFFPMPFRQSARLSLTSFLEEPAAIDYEIEWAPQESQPADMAYFFARWRHEPDSMTFDYPFLETAGRGHFVGVAMPIDHPLGGWWGEGDEKVWVDDDDFPPWIGTGSEDYFGDAWGIRYLSGPSFGASSFKVHRTCNYRWHFMDFVPFATRMRMTIENYGPNGGEPRGQYDYSSTAFWYQAERTPPNETLKGVKYTGGDDPAAKPRSMEYNPNVFPDLNADNVRTYGLGVTFARQAEDLLDGAMRAGRATIVTDAKRPYEFDRERAVDLGTVAAGQKLAELTLTVPSDGVYFPQLYTAPEAGLAELSLEVGGRTLPIKARPETRVLELGGLVLKKGEDAAALVAVTSGHAVLDCLRLQPAEKTAGAIEAEDMTIARAAGGAAPPRPGEPQVGVSSGRVLEFHANQIGEGFVLTPVKEAPPPYVLGVRPILGPGGAIVRAFVAGRPIGPEFDLYAPEHRPGPSVLPLGSIPAGEKDVEIRVVGRNERSSGHDIELDYFRWEPKILGPGSADGVLAQVLGAHDADYLIQDLGPAFSDSHQIWVRPWSKGGWAEVGLDVPRAGRYQVVVKYTKSWDYARIQASLDGAPIGPEVDTFSREITTTEPLTLAAKDLAAGRHVLRFQAVGNNPSSQGYLMGIDHIIIRPE